MLPHCPMATLHRPLWISITAPLLLLLMLLCSGSARPGPDYISGSGKDAMSDNPLRHILRLVRLGTGVDIPPLSLRIREKTLKRARLGTPRNDFVIGSEFLGKREDPEKRMGSEFLGKRMGSEFLGKRMGSEFLGKRMGSEFLGKRMGSEFLGKRMGSEFLGKRMMNRHEEEDEDESELNDGSQGTSREQEMSGGSADKRMGSEFLGKRMGSEFLGRRRRATDDASVTSLEHQYKRTTA